MRLVPAGSEIPGYRIYISAVFTSSSKHSEVNLCVILLLSWFGSLSLTQAWLKHLLTLTRKLKHHVKTLFKCLKRRRKAAVLMCVKGFSFNFSEVLSCNGISSCTFAI